VGHLILEVSAAPISDAGGKVIYAIASLRDVTDTTRFDETLRETRRAYRDLFENAPIGIYRTTPDGVIVMANPALVEMLGFESLDQLRTLNLERDGVHSDYDRSAFKALLGRCGEVRNLEDAWRRRDGAKLLDNATERADRGLGSS